MVIRIIVLSGIIFSAISNHVASACIDPETFGGHNGKPVENINDCFWDYVQCSKVNEGEESSTSESFLRSPRRIFSVLHQERNILDFSHGQADTCCGRRYQRCCEHVTTPPTTTPTVPTPPCKDCCKDPPTFGGHHGKPVENISQSFNQRKI